MNMGLIGELVMFAGLIILLLAGFIGIPILIGNMIRFGGDGRNE